jgi:cytochrome c oxidase cbb3-type subunit 3
LTSGDEARSAALALGRQVYEFNCYFCHGYSGDARTLAAQTLNPPPLNFLAAVDLTPERVETAVRFGRPGTAMKSFASRLSDEEIAAVALYVASGLSGATAYHTEANGWPDHQRRNGAAFAFVNGEIMLDAPDAELSPGEIAGRELFRTACANCHEGRQSEARAEIFRRVDAITGE